jgi:hypothetical protein
MKTIFIIIILLIGLTPCSVLAQQTTSQDSLLNRMVGKWVLQGTIAGKETTHDIIAEWVLDHQYVQLKEVSREKDMNGKPIYEAIVFICWEHKLNQYSCLWLDNTGNGGLSPQAVGHSKANGDKIELLFNGADGSLFHTTFIYNKDSDTWQWLMDGEENGKLQPFTRVKLTKN